MDGLSRPVRSWERYSKIIKQSSFSTITSSSRTMLGCRRDCSSLTSRTAVTGESVLFALHANPLESNLPLRIYVEAFEDFFRMFQTRQQTRSLAF